MTSYRPETSIPVSSSEPARVSENDIKSSGTRYTYVPNIFDLVYPLQRIRHLTKSGVPSAFLQSDAVDSSLLIGHGASFVVSRQTIPPGPEKITTQTSFGNGIATHVVKAPKRPTYVVYKSARVRFKANGDPATAIDSRALLSVLTEFHALSHPYLQGHPNIITLLGLAWGSNHAEPLHRLPVLVIEYGDKGTLADVLSGGQMFTSEIKANICLGIASGLQALHNQDLVHGDMKPENVIICSRKDGTLVPKIADFGFAIVETTETASIYIGGTRIWRAPESFKAVPVAKLKATDVYSFGLVVWSISCESIDPFSLVLPSFDSRESYLSEVDRVKNNEDEVLALSKIENWFLSWLVRMRHKLKNLNQNTDPYSNLLLTNQMDEALEKLFTPASNGRAELTPSEIALKQSIQAMQTSLPIFTSFSQAAFPRCLNKIFASTLPTNPDQRDLGAAISLLTEQKKQPLPDINTPSLEARDPGFFVIKSKDEGSTEYDLKQIVLPHRQAAKYFITNTSDKAKTYEMFAIGGKRQETALQSPLTEQSVPLKIDWASLGFKWHKYTWNHIKDLEPGVMGFVIRTLLQVNDGPGLFMLSACLINGFGIAVDLQRAVSAMAEAARQGHHYARANLYRIAGICAQPLAADVPIKSYLMRAAAEGSRAALADICDLDPERAPNYRAMLRYRHAGVGAYWFAPNQWLCGLDHASFTSADFKVESLGSRDILSDLIVNLKGDHIIHAAAALDACSLLKPLLEDGTLNVNQTNSLGETAILCACRSGHAGMVKLLLDYGANASVQSLNGESPLHWLSSFDPRINPAAVGKDLIERGGAQVDCLTRERVSHSPFHNSVDIDRVMHGTPLYWAVHHNNQLAVAFLLAKGADPNRTPGQGLLSPLERAAHFHRYQCLKLMVDRLDESGRAVSYGPLVERAIEAADSFSMILRNGRTCLSILESTIVYFKEKTSNVAFKLGLNDTVIHFAAQQGKGEFIRIILKHEWLTDQINLPAGSLGRTAILESVRWNRIGMFRLLLKHGADPCILSLSPHNEAEAGRCWSALHLFADQGHNDDMTLVDELLAAGVSIDGDRNLDVESPLSVSIRRNAFQLADHLRAKGASLEAASHSSSLIISRRKLTILGHVIALNGRYSFDSLQYLLKAGAEFITCPEHQLTALHLCVLVPEGLIYSEGTPLKRADFDSATSRTIMRMLLEHFDSRERLDRRLPSIVLEALYPKIVAETGDLNGTLKFFAENGKTALHLAVEVGNLQAVELLMAAGADKDLVCFNETLTFETAADMAERIWKDTQPGLFHDMMEFLADGPV